MEQWPKKIEKIPTKIDKVTSYQQLLRRTILPIARPKECTWSNWQRFILFIYLGTFMRSNSLRIGFENTFEITKAICVKFKNTELWSWTIFFQHFYALIYAHLFSKTFLTKTLHSIRHHFYTSLWRFSSIFCLQLFRTLTELSHCLCFTCFSVKVALYLVFGFLNR